MALIVTSATPRVGTVDFLNARPLCFGLERDPGIRLEAASPARISDLLATGALDVGLLPTIEAARQCLSALPDLGVVARGPVRSVLLVARVPLGKVKVLALDPASRTSSALALLVLGRRHGASPHTVTAADGPDPLAGGADAAVVIGDRALRLVTPHAVWDLAETWHSWTGLPFVFALWAGADERLVRELGPRLRRALDEGLAHLDEIAAASGPALGVPVETARDYLTSALSYRIGAAERAGLDRFLALLREDRALAPEAAIRFVAWP